MKKLLIAGTVALMLATTASVRAERKVGVTAQGGSILQSHSDCDGNHCLDGLWLAGVGMDYEVLDSERFTFRPGVYVYHLEYEESYRETSRDKREKTKTKSANIATAMIRAGVKIWDVVKVYGIGGYSVDSFLVYGGGISLDLDDSWTLEAENLFFDDGCDQHEAITAGVRYRF
jgi:opacity protein-like surface antigen